MPQDYYKRIRDNNAVIDEFKPKLSSRLRRPTFKGFTSPSGFPPDPRGGTPQQPPVLPEGTPRYEPPQYEPPPGAGWMVRSPEEYRDRRLKAIGATPGIAIGTPFTPDVLKSPNFPQIQQEWEKIWNDYREEVSAPNYVSPQQRGLAGVSQAAGKAFTPITQTGMMVSAPIEDTGKATNTLLGKRLAEYVGQPDYSGRQLATKVAEYYHSKIAELRDAGLSAKEYSDEYNRLQRESLELRELALYQ